jgi:hypothetical protein
MAYGNSRKINEKKCKRMKMKKCSAIIQKGSTRKELME